VLEHLGPPLESWWHDLGTVTLSAELKKQLADGVDEELAGTDLAVLTTQRDALLLCLLEQKAAIDARTPRSKLQAMAIAIQSAGQMEARPSPSKQRRERPASRADMGV
jgi:hypothetical protein